MMRDNNIDIAKHFVQNRRVLFGECDPAGVMYTPRITECIVEGALKFVSDSLGEPFERFVFARNMTLPARNLNVDFLKPVTWDDDLEIRAGLHELRTHSYTTQVVALNQSGIAAFSGLVTQVCVNTETKTIAKLPEELRSALQRHE
jgi:acyl-CoA thioesterase FadM